MKKTFSLIFLIIFISTTALTTFAAETTFKGEYRVRAWNQYNLDKKLEDEPNRVISHENAQYDGWFEQRFRLTITHTRSEFLKAVIRMDIVEDTWGQQRNLRINNSAAGNFIDLAYIEFTLPPIGTFTVGKFEEQYGHGLMLSAGHQRWGIEGIRISNSWGPVALSLMYAKLSDRVTSGIDWATGTRLWYNWDGDLGSMNLKIKPNENHLVEIFGGVATDNEWAANSGVGGLVDNSLIWEQGIAWGGWYAAMIGFGGIAYTGTIADMIDIKAEYSFTLGKLKWHNTGRGIGTGPNLAVDKMVQGYNIYLDVAYFNDLMRVGVAFLMTSGQPHWWNDFSTDHYNFNFVFGDNFSWGNIIVPGFDRGINSVVNRRNNLATSTENITSVKLYFEICPVEKLTLNGAVIWAKWSNPIGRSTLATDRGTYVQSHGASYMHPAASYTNYGRNFLNSWTVSDDLGWEIDFGFSYEIMEGLTYSFNMGVLFTGDSFDYEKADGTRGDWGEIWSISNTLLYEF